jgi:hypothetical protein
MRRIATVLMFVAVVAAVWACAADAPAPTSNGGGPGTGPTPSPSPLVVRLFTNNANPPAGSCTLIQAIVSLNGSNVPDGTGVAFATDFGTFQQTGQPLVSVVTQSGAAITAVCSTSPGLANVHAASRVNGITGSATIQISFQSSNQAGPFFSSCAPNIGPNTGGTSLTLNGGRFFGDANTTRVTFTAAGITREAVITSITSSTIVVATPAFPEAVAPTVPVTINVTFGTNTATPTVLTVPNCFVYGTVAAGTPSVTAVVPSSGSKSGNTRVTVVGSGFAVPLQLFFGGREAQLLSVSFNQIIALTPALTPNDTVGPVDVRVHEVNQLPSNDGILAGGFRYVEPLQITSASNTQQRVDLPFSQVIISGVGFQAPVAVTLAGIPARVVSVSGNEVIVVPSTPFVTGCTDLTGPISVTNINTGETKAGPDFIYLIEQTAPIIRSVSPATASPGQQVVVTGFGFGTVTTVVVGGKSVAASFDPASGSIVFPAPDFTNGTPPKCVAPNPAGTLTPVGGAVDIVLTTAFGCTTTASAAFQPVAPCVP